jgi:hypothetical protein
MSKVAPVTVEVLPARLQNHAESVSYLLLALLLLAPRSNVFRLHSHKEGAYRWHIDRESLRGWFGTEPGWLDSLGAVCCTLQGILVLDFSTCPMPGGDAAMALEGCAAHYSILS